MRKADNLPPSCAVVTKSGSLNFLEPSGPVQACNGTAFAFYLWIDISRGFVTGLRYGFGNWYNKFAYLLLFYNLHVLDAGYAVVLRYKPGGRGFDSRWGHWNFSLTQSFRPHYGPGVDSFCNRNEYQEYFLGDKKRPVRKADNLTNFKCRLSRNLGASTSWNPEGLSRPVMGLFYLCLYMLDAAPLVG